MCTVPKQFPEPPKGWDTVDPTPQNPADELYRKCVELRKKIERDIAEEKRMQEMIKEHEYMSILKDMVR